MLITWLIVLVASLYVLTKAADKFTDTAEKIGTIFKMLSFVVGILFVALGTSAPELATSIFGVIKGEAGILAGNVTGSVIANILLGLGLVVVITRKTAKFNWDSVANDMAFLLGAGILLALTIYDGFFGFFEAIIFLLAYGIYVVYSLRIRKMNRKEIREDLHKEIKSKLKEDFKKSSQDKEKTKPHKKELIKLILIFIISLGFLILAAKFTVDSLIEIAGFIGLGTSVLATSIVAIGTSLPEISVAVASAKKGNFDLVLGNIMGSNIFNIFVVFGTIGLFTTISIPSQIIYLVLPVLGGVILVQWLVTIDKKITITEGLLMTILYITFIAKLFNFF